MSKKIIFKGNPYGVFQAFEPNLEQLLTLETTPYDPEDDCTAYQVNLVMEHFRKKNIRMGRLTAENLCQRTSESYTIKAFNMETALPVEIVITKKKIEEILAPFEAEQKRILHFLSSGNTQGILPEFIEQRAKELPLQNRKDLENLFALCQPGTMMYWDEYKSNSPCRLTLAAEITQMTRGVLLYKEQQEQTLQILSGCTPEDAALFRKQNSGIRVDRECRKALISLIAAKQNISAEDAAELYNHWHYYTASSMSVKIAQQAAFNIYKQALVQCRE